MRYEVKYDKYNDRWQLYDTVMKIIINYYQKKHIAYNVCKRMNNKVENEEK